MFYNRSHPNEARQSYSYETSGDFRYHNSQRHKFQYSELQFLSFLHSPITKPTTKPNIKLNEERLTEQPQFNQISSSKQPTQVIHTHQPQPRQTWRSRSYRSKNKIKLPKRTSHKFQNTPHPINQKQYWINRKQETNLTWSIPKHAGEFHRMQWIFRPDPQVRQPETAIAIKISGIA